MLTLLPVAPHAGERGSDLLALDPPPPVPERLAVTAELPRGRAAFGDLLAREAKARGLPPAIADAVASIESGYNPLARGLAGEFGLMQVMPATAAMLGHRGPPGDLLDPEVNARYGVAYLAGAWILARGDLCRALMKYRAGHAEERMSPLSVTYCRRARAHLAAVGSPLAGPDAVAIPVLDRAATGAAVAKPRVGRREIVAAAQRHWEVYVARVRAIERLPAPPSAAIAPVVGSKRARRTSLQGGARIPRFQTTPGA